MNQSLLLKLLAYIADDSWVEQTIIDLHSSLNSDTPPKPHSECKHCNYISQINEDNVLTTVDRVASSNIPKNKGKK